MAGDKAGAAEPPITLQLGTPDSEGAPGTAALKHFASRVAERSANRITIQIMYDAAGDVTDFESDIVRQVRDGELDLGWVGTRVWDEEGLTGFSALLAPFLITGYGVLDEVMTTDLPARMLDELHDVGLTGVGIYPDQLRHPLGFEAPFLTLADFDGAQIRVPSSRLSDDLLRALGAVPVHLNGAALSEAVATGQLRGAETSIGNAAPFPVGSYITINLTFYPKLSTLFAASDQYSSLSEAVRSTLEAAAAETLEFVISQDPEAADIAAFCETGGKLVEASPEDVAEIAAATDGLTHELEADPAIASYIAEIRELKASAPAGPSPRCST